MSNVGNNFYIRWIGKIAIFGSLFSFFYIAHFSVIENETLIPLKIFRSQEVVSADTSGQQKHPARLVIPKLKINASVLDMGLTTDGKMAVPDNYVDVGWYKESAIPGDVGSSVLGAHVDNGYKKPGVFKNLKNLKKGDKIYIYDQEGNKLTFQVIIKKIYDRNISETKDIFSLTDKARLNLITCYGTFIPKLNTYNNRLVVFTEFVSFQSVATLASK